MATDKIIKEATNPIFAQRVALLAIRMAHDVAGESPDDPTADARSLYANTILRGEERALLLVMHVIAASDAIASTLENGTAEDVQDTDIEAALEEVWDARARAATVGDLMYAKAQRVIGEATQVREDIINISAEMRETMQNMTTLYGKIDTKK